jgi:hypothetical protein
MVNSAVADTGCTDHFLPRHCPVENIQPTTNGIVVGLPDTSTMQAAHTCTLKLPRLPRAAQSAHIFPKMQAALLSIPKLCDAGCTAHFSSTTVVVKTKDGTIALVGRRDPLTKLWEVPLAPHADEHRPTKTPSQVSAFANSAHKQKTLEDLIVFLHATAGSPTVATWCPAIDKGHYSTWPGLTGPLVRKYLPTSKATIIGHLHMQRQGVHSTTPTTTPTNDYDDLLPPPRSHLDRAHQVGAHLVNLDQDLKGMISTDLTGRFPFTSSRGMTYLFVLYDYDSNAILACPIQSRRASDIVAGYDFCYHQLADAGIKPIIQRLDN